MKRTMIDGSIMSVVAAISSIQSFTRSAIPTKPHPTGLKSLSDAFTQCFSFLSPSVQSNC